MSRKRKEIIKHITREDIYKGENIPCPLCGKDVPVFRVALIIKEKRHNHRDFLPGKQCPICYN